MTALTEINSLPQNEQNYICYYLGINKKGSIEKITKQILGTEKTLNQVKSGFIDVEPYLYDSDKNRLEKTAEKYMQEVASENPLVNCEQKYMKLIEPNIEKYEEGKAFINTTLIKNKFIDSLKIYDADNKLYYLDTGKKLIEFKPDNQYDIIEPYYQSLQEITKIIVSLNTLINRKPVKKVFSNPNIIKFRDGTYNIKENKKLNEIKKINEIPYVHIDVSNTFKPTEDDLNKTKAILKYLFVEPESFINRCKDIYFNQHLKGFTIIHGVSGSGKTSVIRDIILKRLFNNLIAQVDFFNNILERSNLESNGLSVSVDESDNETKIDASFLNEFTGSKTVSVSRKNTTSKEIKTSHVFILGEDLLDFHDATNGTYARIYLIETHNDITKIDKELSKYITNTDFTDTIYYLIKEAYAKNPEITEQTIDITEYNSRKKDLVTVLKRYIYDSPKDMLGYDSETNQPLSNSFIGLVNRNYDKQKQLNTSETGYRLSIPAILELIDILNEQGKLDRKYDTSKLSRKLTRKILPEVITEYKNDHNKQVSINNKPITIKLDVAPTPEALQLLKQHGLDIEQFHLMNI